MNELTPKLHHSPKCFEATLEVAGENVDATVVHGWLYNAERWILHAWCEIEDRVFDLTITREPIDKAGYYEVMGITPERCVIYDRQAFFAMSAEHGHFGPFNKGFFFAETSEDDPLNRKS